MAFWRLYYHFVWATWERSALITPDIEPELYGYMTGKATSHRAIVHALGGTETHVHMVASVPPTIALSMFMKSIKGSSTHHINHGVGSFDRTFRWQGGYGVFSLGAKQLDTAILYVKHQKEHHRTGSLIRQLEEICDGDDGPLGPASRAAGG